MPLHSDFYVDMKKNNGGKGSGVIVNCSSVGSGLPKATAAILDVYAGTKAMMGSLTRAFAAELAPFNIKVYSGIVIVFKVFSTIASWHW